MNRHQPPTPDVHVINGGSVIGFAFLTDSAQAWQREHLRTEPYQWLGNYLYVDHRFADGIIAGLQNTDLRVDA